MELDCEDNGPLLSLLLPLPSYCTVEQLLNIDSEIEKIQFDRSVGSGRQLLSYLQDYDPAYIFLHFCNKQLELTDIFSRYLEEDEVELVVRILKLICESPFEDNKIVVLSFACQNNLIQQLFSHAEFLTYKSTPKPKIEQYVDTIIHILKCIVDAVPLSLQQLSEQTLSEISNKIKRIEAYSKITLRNKLHILSEIQNKLTGIPVTLLENPSFLKDVSIYPTCDDMLLSCKQELDPNITQGSYRDSKHYLNVQFKLLREDFINPLREGICSFRGQERKGERKHISNVRIYRDVSFISLEEITMDGIGSRISFDQNKRMLNIDWTQSKRLMQGSLLCFSNDVFNTMIFATVLRRHLCDLEKGELIIIFCDGQDIPSDICKKTFIMLESEVYFEPYFHVMKALKNIENARFPMYNYIVEVQTWNDPPEYVLKSNQYREILKDSSWPSADALMLDDSQHLAFKMALTNKFAVIQGPPGTGKTFLGLRIAATLLKNCNVWNDERVTTPILIVCYTNHALDQFLEGLLPVTKLIVRVGGQSKSDALLKYNLREKRRVLYRKKLRDPAVLSMFRDITRLKNLITTVENKIASVKQNGGIISVLTLKQLFVRPVRHIEVCDERFLSWLGGNERPENISASSSGHDINFSRPFVENDLDYSAVDFDNLMSTFQFALNFSSLNEDLAYYQRQISKTLSKSENQNVTYESATRVGILENCVMQTDEKIKHFMSHLSEMTVCDADLIRKIYSGFDPWLLTVKERWNLYCYWRNALIKYLEQKLVELKSKFVSKTRQYKELLLIEDLKILRSVLVVGMTTTGAAKLQPVLQALRSKIVIVEEAAEVMEAHILASLTPYCEHLILIGDHQQLRPTTADYGLARNYHFDVSLFERMLKNGMNYEVLKVQHRMRPEIAKLISPAIYPRLENHHSVNSYENILGVARNMFFITHSQLDEEVKHSLSRRNIYEAKYLMALCEYLLNQGYPPASITILTTYSGQMFYLRKLAGMSKVHGVPIRVVDEFQGEECDIILLSLVRSNKEGIVGFLNIENRVCVALSRAKKGFFIIGNIQTLTKTSRVWVKIERVLNNLQCVGPRLPIQCQIHSESIRFVEKPGDFSFHAPNGGCTQICNQELPCGHRCKQTCHIKDMLHVEYKCCEPCARDLTDCTHHHRCQKRCWEKCDTCEVSVRRNLPCGHESSLECSTDYSNYKCESFVNAVIPECGHNVIRPCHMTTMAFSCSNDCGAVLKCGHRCELKCHVKNDPTHATYKCMKPCNKSNTSCISDPVHKCTKLCHEPCGLCMVKVEKSLPHCNHKHMVECSLDPAIIRCEEKCDRSFPCGHACTKLCYENCGNCTLEVSKRLPMCAHEMVVKCYEQPDPKMCVERCIKRLYCGHQCASKCNELCTMQCTHLVKSPVEPVCGHNITIPCYLSFRSLEPDSQDLLKYCKRLCWKTLPCGHECKGTCGTCLQGRIHVPCEEKCEKTLLCGHSCTLSCAEKCPPCNQLCRYKCPHSQCTRKCGQPCVPCMEPCQSCCKHNKCYKLCYQICVRLPCNYPCEKILNCGHPCIGFCGDPCPKLCGVCNRQDLISISSRSTVYSRSEEDEIHNRFVELVDCGHVVPAFVNAKEPKLPLKTCPICKAPVINTEHYTNETKKLFETICDIRNFVFEKLNTVNSSQSSLIVKMRNMKCSSSDEGNKTESKFFKMFYGSLLSKLHQVQGNWRSDLAHIDMETLCIKFEVMFKIWSVMQEVGHSLTFEQMQIVHKYSDFILYVIGSSRERITAQELNDINTELKRWICIVEICYIENSRPFRDAKKQIKVTLSKAMKLASSSRRLTEDSYKTVMKKIGYVCKEVSVHFPRILKESVNDITVVAPFIQSYWDKNLSLIRVTKK